MLDFFQDQDWVGQGFNFTSDLDSHGSDDISWKPSHSIKTSKAGNCKKNTRKRKGIRDENGESAGDNTNLENGTETNDLSEDDELQTESKKRMDALTVLLCNNHIFCICATSLSL